MIDKREIIDTATALGLNPHVVEKDYVLGWLLWGVRNHRAVGDSWTFKGGTCLKKCFFETYRFSEDLDFTLDDPAHVDEGFLNSVFSEITERIYEETGIEFPSDARKFEVYENPRGRPSCQTRIGYRGPVSPRGRNVPRIKFDLTADERVVLPPVQSRVFHPYSDAPEGGIVIRSYAYEEAFGEKVRALAERARPRDLYDVINLFRNDEARPAAAVLLDVLGQKCAFKGMDVPAFAGLEPQRTLLEGNWGQMLAHQLPVLPPFVAFWDELPVFFDWLRGGFAPSIPAAYVGAVGERDAPRAHAAPSSDGPITVASRSHPIRRIEPALRGSALSGIDAAYRTLLAAPDQGGKHHSACSQPGQGRTAQLSGGPDRGLERHWRDVPSAFRDRADTRGALGIAPTRRGGSSAAERIGPTTTRMTRVRSRRGRRGSGLASPSGPTYVYQCVYCGKRFSRRKQAHALNPHKDKNGFPCAGRHAVLIDMRL